MSKLKVWETDDYYNQAQAASLDINHPSMKQLKQLSKNAKKILDLGCGEGTRLQYLATNNGVGIDISKKAITRAKKKDKNNMYKVGNLEKLDLANNEFDLVYSAFVLEHTQNPEKVILEAIRVTKKNGILLFVCPNYGAPNRSSPPAKYNRLTKLSKGFVNDLLSLISKSNSLQWIKVAPLEGKYFSDSDTTIEPYARSLNSFLSLSGINVKYSSTLWNEEIDNASIIQKVFRYLGELDIYPFKYWGPHILIYGKKH